MLGLLGEIFVNSSLTLISLVGLFRLFYVILVSPFAIFLPRFVIDIQTYRNVIK